LDETSEVDADESGHRLRRMSPAGLPAGRIGGKTALHSSRRRPLVKLADEVIPFGHSGSPHARLPSCGFAAMARKA
jgi:hypothetical protein